MSTTAKLVIVKYMKSTNGAIEGNLSYILSLSLTIFGGGGHDVPCDAKNRGKVPLFSP